MRRNLPLICAVLIVLGCARTGVPAATRAVCARTRPAIAADARGTPLRPQPKNGPIPCGGTTGFGGGETRIFVTKSGAVIYAPAIFTPGPLGLGYAEQAPGPRFQFLASPSGLAVSRNKGATWKSVLPLGMTWQPSDEQEYVDRDTGRFFFYNFGGNPFPQTAALPGSPDAALFPGMEAHLLWTNDDGTTWHHGTGCCPALSENPRFLAAKAPSGAAKPTGYPNVVYFCANAAIMLVNQVPGARVCSRSLDGGSTWSTASVLISHPVPQHTECGTTGEDFGPGDGSYPQAMPDGSLVVMISCGRTYLARSTDEAATWPIARAIPAFDELRTDTKGVLYGLRLTSGKLVLRISRDVGRTWSSEMSMTAPGVTVGAAWNMSVRGPGNVAVSYYGHRAGQATSDGYITQSHNASSKTPVFWSGVLNDPRTPMLNDGSSRPPTDGVGYLDFMGADIGPDGSAWGSFIQDCGANDTDGPCGDGHTHAMWGVRAFAGRLLWP